MNIIRQTTRLLLSKNNINAYKFSDSWKERDQAQQKVYISRKEKDMMKKLLQKIQQEQSDNQSNLEEFERKLNEIMKRYKITNDTVASQIINLHREMRQ